MLGSSGDPVALWHEPKSAVNAVLVWRVRSFPLPELLRDAPPFASRRVMSAMPVQGGQQTDRPAAETDSTPLGTGVSLDTFLRRDANGHHFESSYPVPNSAAKDSASLVMRAGAALFRSPGRTKMEDVGVALPA